MQEENWYGNIDKDIEMITIGGEATIGTIAKELKRAGFSVVLFCGEPDVLVLKSLICDLVVGNIPRTSERLGPIGILQIYVVGSYKGHKHKVHRKPKLKSIIILF